MPTSETVGSKLRDWAYEDSGRAAFIFCGCRPGNNRLVLTRRELYDLASTFCGVLNEAGLGPGQVVCNTLPNSPERLITDLGCMMAGVATLNGMMYLLDGEDLTRCLTRGGCSALVVDPSRQPSIFAILGDRVIIRGENARSRLVPDLRKMFNVDCGGGSELRPWLQQMKQRGKYHPDPIDPSELAVIFNTAGTIGFSRLVTKSHSRFLLMGRTLHELMNLDPSDIVFNDRSLGWFNGTCCDYLAGGYTRVLVDMTVPPPDPLAFAWETCLAEHCTVCFLLPPAITASLSKPALWSGKRQKPRTIVSGQ
ncbi:hypothetical protein ACOMHN_051481 [Nucella lapillus]